MAQSPTKFHFGAFVSQPEQHVSEDFGQEQAKYIEKLKKRTRGASENVHHHIAANAAAAADAIPPAASSKRTRSRNFSNFHANLKVDTSAHGPHETPSSPILDDLDDEEDISLRRDMGRQGNLVSILHNARGDELQPDIAPGTASGLSNATNRKTNIGVAALRAVNRAAFTPLNRVRKYAQHQLKATFNPSAAVRSATKIPPDSTGGLPSIDSHPDGALVEPPPVVMPSKDAARVSPAIDQYGKSMNDLQTETGQSGNQRYSTEIHQLKLEDLFNADSGNLELHNAQTPMAKWKVAVKPFPEQTPEIYELEMDPLHAYIVFALAQQAAECPMVSLAKYAPAAYLAAVAASQTDSYVPEAMLQTLDAIQGAGKFAVSAIGTGAKRVFGAGKATISAIGKVGHRAMVDTAALWSDKVATEQSDRNRTQKAKMANFDDISEDATALPEDAVPDGIDSDDESAAAVTQRKEARRAFKLQLNAASAAILDDSSGSISHQSSVATTDSDDSKMTHKAHKVLARKYHATGAEALSSAMQALLFEAFSGAEELQPTVQHETHYKAAMAQYTTSTAAQKRSSMRLNLDEDSSPSIEPAEKTEQQNQPTGPRSIGEVLEAGHAALHAMRDQFKTIAPNASLNEQAKSFAWELDQYASLLRRAMIICSKQLSGISAGANNGHFDPMAFENSESLISWRRTQQSTLKTAIDLYSSYLRVLQPRLADVRYQRRSIQRQPTSVEEVKHVCGCIPVRRTRTRIKKPKHRRRTSKSALEAQTIQRFDPRLIEDLNKLNDNSGYQSDRDLLLDAGTGADPVLTKLGEFPEEYTINPSHSALAVVSKRFEVVAQRQADALAFATPKNASSNLSKEHKSSFHISLTQSDIAPRQQLGKLVTVLLRHANKFQVKVFPLNISNAGHLNRSEKYHLVSDPMDIKDSVLDEAMYAVVNRLSPVARLLLQEYCVRYRITTIRLHIETFGILAQNLGPAIAQRRRLTEIIMAKYDDLDDEAVFGEGSTAATSTAGSRAVTRRHGKSTAAKSNENVSHLQHQTPDQRTNVHLSFSDASLIHDATMRLYIFLRYLRDALSSIEHEVQRVTVRQEGRGRAFGLAVPESATRALRHVLRDFVQVCAHVVRQYDSLFPLMCFKLKNVHQSALQKEKEERERQFKNIPMAEKLRQVFDETCDDEPEVHNEYGDPCFLLFLGIFSRAWTLLQHLCGTAASISSSVNSATLQLQSTPFAVVLGQILVERTRIRYEQYRQVVMNTVSDAVSMSLNEAGEFGTKALITPGMASFNSPTGFWGARSPAGANATQSQPGMSHVSASTGGNLHRRNISVNMSREDVRDFILGLGGVGGSSVVILARRTDQEDLEDTDTNVTAIVTPSKSASLGGSKHDHASTAVSVKLLAAGEEDTETLLPGDEIISIDGLELSEIDAAVAARDLVTSKMPDVNPTLSDDSDANSEDDDFGLTNQDVSAAALKVAFAREYMISGNVPAYVDNSLGIKLASKLKKLASAEEIVVSVSREAPADATMAATADYTEDDLNCVEIVLHRLQLEEIQRKLSKQLKRSSGNSTNTWLLKPVIFARLEQTFHGKHASDMATNSQYSGWATSPLGQGLSANWHGFRMRIPLDQLPIHSEQNNIALRLEVRYVPSVPGGTRPGDEFETMLKEMQSTPAHNGQERDTPPLLHAKSVHPSSSTKLEALHNRSASVSGKKSPNSTGVSKSSNPFSLLPKAALSLASGFGTGIYKGARFAVALPTNAAKYAVNAVQSTWASVEGGHAGTDANVLTPAEALRERYPLIAHAKVKLPLFPLSQRQRPGRPTKVWLRQDIESESKTLPERFGAMKPQLEQNIPIFLEIGLGFVHFNTVARLMENEVTPNELGGSMSLMSDSINSQSSADNHYPGHMRKLSRSSKPNGHASADFKAVLAETEEHRLLRLFGECMGPPPDVEQMRSLAYATAADIDECSEIEAFTADVAIAATFSFRLEAFYASFTRGNKYFNGHDAAHEASTLSDETVATYIEAVRRYILLGLDAPSSTPGIRFSSVLAMQYLHDVDRKPLRIESFDFDASDKSMALRDATYFAVLGEPYASSRTISSCLVLALLSNPKETSSEILGEHVQSRISDLYTKRVEQSLRSWLPMIVGAVMYAFLRVDIRRGLLSIQPSPDRVVDGIFGQQGLFAVLKVLHNSVRALKYPKYTPLLHLDALFESYVPGWIAGRRKLLMDTYVPRTVQTDKPRPLKPDHKILHSSSAQNIFWLCLEHLRLFKDLPQASKEENIARFVQHLLIDPVVQYTESQAAAADVLLASAVANPSHPLQSFWGLSVTSKEGKEAVSELCVRINNISFVRQKLFSLLQAVNELDNVNDATLETDTRTRQRERVDSDASVEDQASVISRSTRPGVIRAIRVYKLWLRVECGYNLPRLDAGGLRPSDPYARVLIGGSAEELRAHMSESAMTRVIKNCSDPVWNQEFTLVTAVPNALLHIQVWDWDGNEDDDDDLIGNVTVPLAVLLSRGQHKLTTGLRRPRPNMEGEDDVLIVSIDEDHMLGWDNMCQILGKIAKKRIDGDVVQGPAGEALTASLPMYMRFPNEINSPILPHSIGSNGTSSSPSISTSSSTKRNQKSNEFVRFPKSQKQKLQDQAIEWFNARRPVGQLSFSVQFDSVDIAEKAVEAVEHRLHNAVLVLCRGMHRHIRPLVVDAVCGQIGTKLANHQLTAVSNDEIDEALAGLAGYLDEQLALLYDIVYPDVVFEILSMLWQGITVELHHLLLPTVEFELAVSASSDIHERRKARTVNKGFLFKKEVISWLHPSQLQLLTSLYTRLKQFFNFEGFGLTFEYATKLAGPLEGLLEWWEKPISEIASYMYALHARARAAAENEYKKRQETAKQLQQSTGKSIKPQKVTLLHWREPSTGFSYQHMLGILQYQTEVRKTKTAKKEYENGKRLANEI